MRRLMSYMIGVLVLAATSCTHKELCMLHPHTADVTIISDWSDFTDKDVPSGMTVMVYPQEGGEVVRHLTHDITRADLSLPVGLYHSVVFNQSESEFGSVLFRGMDSYETAEVYSNLTKSTWYKTRTEEERLGEEPEWIGTSRHEGAVVTQEMIYATGEAMLAALPQQRSEPGFVIAQHAPQNIIYTVSVTVHIKGFHNLRSARASLNGLAEGYFLGTGRYSSSKVTQLMERWSKSVDVHDPTKGTINTVITCFGLPDGHGATADENILNLSLLLVDNTTIMDYTFKVGDKFVHEEGDGVDVSLSLELELEIDEPLPDVKPVDGANSGFDATVSDWGEEENYEIGI